MHRIIARLPLLFGAAQGATVLWLILSSGHGARHPAASAAALATSAVATVVLWFMVRRSTDECAAALRYLEMLAQVDGVDGAAPTNLDALPTVDSHSAWRRPLQRLRDLIAVVQDRQAAVETTTAALDIRLQRTMLQLELVSSVLSRIGVPVYAVDAYDELLYVNAEAERLPIVAQRKSRTAGDGGDEKLASLVADIRRRKVAARRSEDVELSDAEGRRRWYRATVDNLGRSDDGGGGAVVVLRDVGSERDVQRRHAEFVSAASHEMKTPLAGIKAYVELLADGDAEDEKSREEFLDVINGQADRLQRLIENLLNIARIEAGVVKVSKQSRSVNEILTEALGVVRPTAEAKQITLAADLSPLYLGALIDRDMFLQAVINLLSNAVKYTPSGGRVTLRSRLTDQEIRVEVEDTGVGLSETDCARVFEKFYRVEKDKSMAAGTGLGLPLARHIVEDVHGGRLTVRSRLGEGSTFTIDVPSAGRSVE